jgi:hypothetical protein
MSRFGRRPALYGNDPQDHKPIGLFICGDCFAAIPSFCTASHDKWHDGQGDKENTGCNCDCGGLCE